MSTLMQAAAAHLPLADPTLATQYLATRSQALLAAGTDGGGQGILDWATTKNTQVQNLMIAFGATVGVIIVIIAAVSSRGSLVRILLALITAGVVVWGVSSVRSMRDRVDQEVNGMTAPTTSQSAETLTSTRAGTPAGPATGPGAPTPAADAHAVNDQGTKPL